MCENNKKDKNNFSVSISFFLFGCSFTSKEEKEANNYYNIGDYKSAIAIYSKFEINDSTKINKCVYEIKKEAINIVTNYPLNRKEDNIYYEYEIENEPIVTILDDLITIEIEILFKNENSTYNPKFLVTFDKEYNQWMSNVEITSFEHSTIKEFNIADVMEELSYDYFYNFEIVYFDDSNSFHKEYTLNGKQLCGYKTNDCELMIKADYNSKANSWIWTKIEKVISTYDTPYKTCKFSTFSIDVPDYWTYIIDDEYYYEYGSGCTVLFYSNNIYVLLASDSYYLPYDGESFPKLDTHCVQNDFGLVCPYDKGYETNSLDLYVVEGKGHHMAITRHNEVEDCVFYRILESIE